MIGVLLLLLVCGSLRLGEAAIRVHAPAADEEKSSAPASARLAQLRTIEKLLVCTYEAHTHNKS